MRCKLCQSLAVNKVDNFAPYVDRKWSFEIYNCTSCHIRFAVRDNDISYHEELHTTENSPYLFHYKVSEEFKKLLSTDLKKCESILYEKSPVLKKLLTYIASYDKDISILEIGCSTGYVIAYLQKIGYKNSLGIDISSNVIEYACETFGDFYATKEDDNTKYDVIFHTGLIGCVDNPIEFLNHYLEILKPGGIMYFNAPNIDSISEVNELWVSTPPPDLIYLFKDNVFSRLIHGSYKIEVEKTLSPLVILRKYINRIKNKKNNIYPRKFIREERRVPQKSSKVLKTIISFFITILVKIGIMKHYSDDYGLIYTVKKL